ncbi:type I-B CRISPR-associated protein Cas8b1/Cst1 [Bacillus luti]|nr:type I-B CRISPR-associated protein Cas8b1/Cst1 [Bacillus cereus]
MKAVKLNMYDYFSNAGLVGMYRVLERSQNVKKTVDGIEVTASSFRNFAEEFIDLLLEDFSVLEQDRIRMESALAFASKQSEDVSRMKEWFKLGKERIAKRIDDNYKKCVKAKLDPDLLIGCKEVLGEIKALKYEEKETLQVYVAKYLDFLRNPEIFEKLTLNYIRYVLGMLHGQVSFLNPAFKGEKREYIEKLQNDFVLPMQQEMHLMELRENVSVEDRDAWYKAKAKESNSKIETSILKTIQRQEKGFGRFVPCSIFPELPGTISFEEKIFYPLGLSLENAENTKWNGSKGVPISHTARLVMFCTGLGMLLFNKRLMDTGYIGEMKYQPFFGFVNADTSFIDMLALNKEFRLKKNVDNPFKEMLLTSLVKETDQISKWTLENLLYVEFGVEGKNTKLQYFHISRGMAEYITSNDMTLMSMRNRELRTDVLSLLLNSNDTFQLLQRKLKEHIKEGRCTFDIFVAVSNQVAVRYYKNRKGDKQMNRSIMESFYYAGRELRDSYTKEGKANQLQGINYRLLNAVQSGNKDNLMDTILRMYIAQNRMVPQTLLQIHHETYVTHKEAGHAFIAGLNGQKGLKSSKEVDGKVENTTAIETDATSTEKENA